MTKLYFETVINSAKEIVFDLSRSIDFHQESLKKTKEKATKGRTSGHIELGETVTWRGKHFGFYLTHESKISQMSKYGSFTDEMINGCFKSFIHHHRFITQNNSTVMIDEIIYETPFGILGKIFNESVLKKYLIKIIIERNTLLKLFAEKQSG
ncbi:SRPBCC family protein [Flavobacterium sp. H122]|uniref:SRPBCC family protein n=1 Tax=Flavobacterium sp. H122 TaxID=2529860 RepID=UPI0010A9AB8D|nr:SRPBCC family protein [Flavobacterium sp. H122]